MSLCAKYYFPLHLVCSWNSTHIQFDIELGENAKARFQIMAQKIKANIERTKNKSSFGEYSGSPVGGASERRGLLDLHDDEEQEISFVTEDNTEMRSMDFAYDKRNKSSKQD